MKQIITNNKIIDDVYYVEKVGDTTFQRIITAIYKGGKQVWELIMGYLFTKSGDTLQTKDNKMLKCKNQ